MKTGMMTLRDGVVRVFIHRIHRIHRKDECSTGISAGVCGENFNHKKHEKQRFSKGWKYLRVALWRSVSAAGETAIDEALKCGAGPLRQGV
jgi:H+/Cl- antiporter ClcA